MNWNNKVVWITGASSGIGEELVYQLCSKGAKIILSSRNRQKLEDVKAHAELSDANCMILPMDLMEYHNFDSYVIKVIEKFGRIDVLINNAGMTQRSFVIDTAIEVDKKLMAVNYFGPVALTKAVLPYFIKQKRGHVVVTSSVAGKLSTPLRSAYCASKHALHGFFESLNAEMDHRHIHVSIICPGFIQTNISTNALTGDGSKHAKMDEAQASGLSVEECVRQYIHAIERKKPDVIISAPKEKFAVMIKRFFPSLLRKMVRKVKVT